ncbi:unnamed protein product [Linum trigynum]|uniref:Uncharacterized protein n=1 Tax=Linum trigynum TaxID=586398 RepID=A0AAV2CBD4_9ROSI
MKKQKVDDESKAKNENPSSSLLLHGFVSPKIIYPNRLNLSSYTPSCLMMDYIVHCINRALADNFYFKRASPNYHPYILRLYFGIIFWIQCLRAGNNVAAIPIEHHQFLTSFLSFHPLETLPIPGPLLVLFKTLCCSQPEIKSYGTVYPRLPTHPGPKKRSKFVSKAIANHFLPNVPGIFALLHHLNSLVNAKLEPIYPKLGKHCPVPAEGESPTTFGHHIFPASSAERTELEKWSLVTPGLQYPCEADQKLNEAFAERFGKFGFPKMSADDDLTNIWAFMGMEHKMAWFNQVKGVAETAAEFFDGSGTLADCSVDEGLVSNQIVCVMSSCEANKQKLKNVPTCSADWESLMAPFTFKLKTTARSLPPFAEAAAAYSQTHIRVHEGHPMYGSFGQKSKHDGPFWEIRPIESSPVDDSSYSAISWIVYKMHKTR